MRSFVLKCLEGRDGLMMLPYVGMDEYSVSAIHTGKLPGYITCKSLKESFSSSGFNGGSGRPNQPNSSQQGSSSAGGGSSSASMLSGSAPNGVPMDPVVNISKRLWMTSQKVMMNCAFVKDFLGFHRCIFNLMKEYDFRTFFGGMSMYHDGEGMARLLNIPNPERFASDFVHGINGKVDPLMLPSKLPSLSGGNRFGGGGVVGDGSGNSSDTEYCISLRVWDLFLWFAMMQRPRRDVGIMHEVAKTLTQYCMQLLPRSIYPFEVVPMAR